MAESQTPRKIEKPRNLSIPRKPIPSRSVDMFLSPVSPICTPDSEGPIPYEYIPYRSPIEAPTVSAPAQIQYVPYRRPSLSRHPANRGRMSRVSVSSGSMTAGSYIDGGVSPLSPADSRRSYFQRQSAQQIVESVSREVSVMKSNIGSRRFPLSPLMELSAQEAAYRNSILSTVTSRPPPEPLMRSHTCSSSPPPPGLATRPWSSIFREPRCEWQPVALRWPFLLTLFLMSVGLAGLTLGITLRSQKNKGLWTVQNTGIFLFGWRFMPTTFAVIFTLLTMLMVRDIKRTEPFARLSRPDGASAGASLFLKFRAIWFEPIDALRQSQNDGFRNWALFWALMINLMGLFFVTPFSAAFLSPRDILLTKGAPISQLGTSGNLPMQLSSDDTVLFRTVSSVLLNTTSSAWITDDFVVRPVWPSSLVTMPVGSKLSGTPQLWTANTTVYQIGLKCAPMNLQKVANISYTKKISFNSDSTVFGTVNLTSFVLGSDDGCTFGLTGYPPVWSNSSIFKSGGGWWSSAPNFDSPALWPSSNGMVQNMDEEKPITVNTSTQCGDRSIFFLVSPYDQNKDIQATGQVCKSTYFSANLPVTVSSFGSSSTISFDMMRFNITKDAVDVSHLNITGFESSFLSQDWSTKFHSPDLASNPLLSLRPKFGGPLALVGAQNDFNLQTMFRNPNIVDQARRIKQRFFGEAIMASFTNTNNQSPIVTVGGNISIGERRIVASFPVGILLTAVFLLCSLQIGLVTGYTRLHERPLNLSQDPSSVAALASLVSTGQNTRALFEGLDATSEAWMHKQLSRNVFFLRHGVLFSFDVRDTYQYSETSSHAIAESKAANSKDWRPKILRWWLLGPLLVSLFAIILALALLYSFYVDSGISQIPLNSEFNLNRGNENFIAWAPYSVIPTLLAVGLMLWWDSMDQKIRQLQPLISMAKEATLLKNGLKLSYSATPILWIVWKAVRNTHFLVALVAFGAVLSHIFIVSVSGIWNRQHGFQENEVSLYRTMDLRTVPAIFTVPSVPNTRQGTQWNMKNVLANIYGSMSSDWLYQAAIEGTDNGTSVPWTRGDWAFASLDMSSLQKSSSLNETSSVTIDTSSLRGRLTCKPIDMSKTASWVSALDFTNKDAWDDPRIPADLQVGYELKIGLSVNKTNRDGAYTYWDDEHPYFSFFAADEKTECCGTENNELYKAASIGYWSAAGDAKHSSVVVKWVSGNAFGAQFIDADNQAHLVWKEVPKVTALKCDPVYETANARVEVDVLSGMVQGYDIVESPLPDPNAWSHLYQDLNVSRGVPYTNKSTGEGFEFQPSKVVHNVSVSYGYLFNDALLNAANSARISNNETATQLTENLADHTYNFRLPGLNADFMSYTSLALAHNNISALLDPNILGNVSSTVFSLFFKHFALAAPLPNRALYMNGTFGLQPRGEQIPHDLGATLSSPAVFLQSKPQPPRMTSIATATVSTLVELIIFNKVSVILSFCILGILFTITTVLLAVHKNLYSKLPRDVDTIGSILGFVYGSERLLSSTTETIYKHKHKNSDEQVYTASTEKASALSINSETKAKMGWFNSGGKRRWGIEIVDPRRTQDETIMSGGLHHGSDSSFDFQLPIHGERDSFSVPMNESLRQRSYSTGVRDRSSSIRRAASRASNMEEGNGRIESMRGDDNVGRLYGAGREGGLQRGPSLAFSFDTLVREPEPKKAPSPAPAGPSRWYDSL